MVVIVILLMMILVINYSYIQLINIWLFVRYIDKKLVYILLNL